MTDEKLPIPTVKTLNDVTPDEWSRSHRDWLASQRSPLTTQVGGSHYKDTAIQPVEFIQKNNLGFCEGNAIKYLVRHKSKGGRKDVEKAIHYLELLLELDYGK